MQDDVEQPSTCKVRVYPVSILRLFALVSSTDVSLSTGRAAIWAYSNDDSDMEEGLSGDRRCEYGLL